MKQTVLSVGLVFAALASAQTVPVSQIVPSDQPIREALAKNLDLPAEKRNSSVAESREITARIRPNPVLTVSGATVSGS